MSNTITPNSPAPPRPLQDVATSARPAPAAAADPRVAVVKQQGPDAVKSERTPTTEEGRGELKRALAQLNEQARKDGRNLNFSIDDQLDRVVITVRQSETGEVIRQIPSDAVLRVAHNLKAVRGLLYNETI